MKLFCSYAFTGEDIDALTKRMQSVVDALAANGHDAYCNRFDPIVDKLQEQDDIKGIFSEAFKQLDECEAVIAIVASPARSIGQIMEIGIAMKQGKPVYLFEHTSAAGSSYLPRLVDKQYTWETTEDLERVLAEI